MEYTVMGVQKKHLIWAVLLDTCFAFGPMFGGFVAFITWILLEPGAAYPGMVVKTGMSHRVSVAWNLPLAQTLGIRYQVHHPSLTKSIANLRLFGVSRSGASDLLGTSFMYLLSASSPHFFLSQDTKAGARRDVGPFSWAPTGGAAGRPGAAGQKGQSVLAMASNLLVMASNLLAMASY